MTSNKTKVAILVAQGVQDEEFLYPYYRIQEEGFEMDVILSPHPKYPNPTGKYGIPIKSNKTTTNLYTTNGVLVSNYDIVIIPGGWQAPEIMRMDEKILRFLQHANNHKTIIAAICHGPQVLISAKIVSGRKITGYQGIRDDIVNAGAIYIDNGVIIDNNIITAQHYKDNPEFLKSILNTYYDFNRPTLPIRDDKVPKDWQYPL